MTKNAELLVLTDKQSERIFALIEELFLAGVGEVEITVKAEGFVPTTIFHTV